MAALPLSENELRFLHALLERNARFMGNHQLKVLSLRRILVSKRAANRAKDRLVIPVLEDALAVRDTPRDPHSGAKE